MDKLLLLILGAAVQSSQRQEIIASLKNMPVKTQHAFMEKITEVWSFLYLVANALCGQYYKLFMAVITPLAAYFSKILTELRR